MLRLLTVTNKLVCMLYSLNAFAALCPHNGYSEVNELLLNNVPLFFRQNNIQKGTNSESVSWQNVYERVN